MLDEKVKKLGMKGYGGRKEGKGRKRGESDGNNMMKKRRLRRVCRRGRYMREDDKMKRKKIRNIRRMRRMISLLKKIPIVSCEPG
jgi:hypothetical protein